MSRLDAVLRDGDAVRGLDGSSRVSEGGVREHDEEGARAFAEKRPPRWAADEG